MIMILAAVYLFSAGAGITCAANGAKYVFLFIGDGMGYAQRNAAETYLAGARMGLEDTEPRASQLVMNGFPVTGNVRTNSLSGITDSAAAATAIATGKKTVNGAVGMNPKTGEKYVSIAMRAMKTGMKVGIVTSAFLQDATPAAFYGQVPKRTDYYSLGRKLCESGFDYFGGGGFRNPTGRKGEKKPNLSDVAARSGYTVASGANGLESLKRGKKAIAVHPKLSAGSMPFAIDGMGPGLALSDFVKKGIELLDCENGFLLVVEGGRIDIACHANDAASAIHEVIAFDEALAAAVAFYGSRPNETLIVVTSDHETGGMSLDGIGGPETFYRALSRQKGSYAAFERTVSPVAGAKIENYMRRAREFFGEFPEKPAAAEAIGSAFRMSMTPKASRPSKKKEYKRLYGPYDPFTMSYVRELGRAAGVKWSTFYHTGGDVAISAVGAGAEYFAGEYEISEIHGRLLQAMGFSGSAAKKE